MLIQIILVKGTAHNNANGEKTQILDIDLFPNNNRRPFAHILAAARFGKIRQYGYIGSLTSTSPRAKYDQGGFDDYPGTSLILLGLFIELANTEGERYKIRLFNGSFEQMNKEEADGYQRRK